MAHIMLVNPRKRRGKKRRSSGKKRRRSSGKRRTYSKRRSAPRKRRSSRRRARRGGGLTIIRRRRGLVAGYRANPIARGIPSLGQVKGIVTDAAIGGAGAIANDVLIGMIPLPDVARTGIGGYVAKGIGAIAIGLVGGKVFGSSVGGKLTSGAMTVLLYKGLREAAATYAPQIPLGEYLSGDDDLGYLSPAISLGTSADGFSGTSPMALPVLAPVGFDGMGEYVGEYEDAYAP